MKPLGISTLRGTGARVLAYVALAAALGGVAVLSTRAACDGEYVPPLDDTYIYLQYARGAAAGHPFAYQEDAEPTRGATSILYPLLLAPAARVLSPDQLPWAGWALGVLFLAGIALTGERWAARRLGGGGAAAAALLPFLSGHLVWGAASGMDIALFAFALSLAVALVPWYLEASSRGAGLRRLSGLAGALFLLGLARPEGLLPAFGIALAIPLATRAPNTRRGRAILILAPLAALLLTTGVETLALGKPGPNTLAAKAVWSEQRPDVRQALLARLPWVLGQITHALFSDFRSPAFGHGTGLLLAALFMGGAAAGACVAFFPRRGGIAERVLLGVLLSGLLSGLVPVGFNSHHFRYQIPYIPLALWLALLGWWRIVPPRARLLPPVLLGALLLPGLIRYEGLVGKNAADIRGHQVAMGRWIDAHLPAEAVVGLNDAGAIAYYGRRPVVDLVGLVTNGSALPHRAGPASLYEWLESLPPTRRPTHFAIFPDWFPYLRETSLLGEKLVQFTLAQKTISGANVECLYVADWSRVPLGRKLWSRRELVEVWGFAVVDEVDVADLDSERAHAYTAFPTWRSTLREFPVAELPDVVFPDGGRQPARGERFRLRCRPGLPGALVLRTEAFRGFTLEVRVDGRPAGTWTIPAAPLKWTEPVFSLVDSLFTAPTAEFELTLADSIPAYPSFHYWLLQ